MINNKDLDNSSYKSYKILIDGKAISEAVFPVISIQTILNVNKIPAASIVIRDGEEDIDKFEISSKSTFDPGNEIEIKMGWGGNDYTVFKGLIIRHAINASKRKGFYLKVYCRNESLKMTNNKKYKCYSDLDSDDAIISEVFNNYSIDVSCNGDFIKNNSLIQYEISDWDFVMERIEANAKILYYNISNNNYVIETPESPSSPLNTFTLGRDIVDFEVEADSEFQIDNISISTWDSSEQEMKIIDSLSNDFKVFEKNSIKNSQLSSILCDDEVFFKHSGDRNTDEFSFWRKAKEFRSSFSKVKGSIQIIGDSRYELCDCISIDGAGSKFSDNLLITGIRHTFNADGFYTDLIFGLELPSQSDYLPNRMNDSSLFSNISSLQIGKVCNIVDEESLYRIQVKIPVLGEDSMIWCRMLSTDAGNDRGFFCLPEIDDEVLLGFINNDPQCPVILGSLYSSANTPPVTDEEITEDNNIKGWFSKSKIQIKIDDEAKSLTIETPDNNKIVLNDELKSIELSDTNENKIQLNDSGMNIESTGDVILKSNSSITFSSDGDINIEGANVSISAQQKASVDGASGTDITSSGNTVVKGSMVQIN